MNTTQLECFLAVANFLNFSRAAEQLRITQPAVSHQISSLEDELGTKLFFRTSKSVRLTQAGHLFTQYANEILKLSGLSRARLKECQETLPQRFGIGCRNFIELRLLRPVLAQLGQQQPRLLPVLRLLPYASLENLLAEDDVQVLLSLQESAPSKAVYRELARCPLVCICTPDHPLAAYDQLTIEQVKNGGPSGRCWNTAPSTASTSPATARRPPAQPGAWSFSSKPSVSTGHIPIHSPHHSSRARLASAASSKSRLNSSRSASVI